MEVKDIMKLVAVVIKENSIVNFVVRNGKFTLFLGSDELDDYNVSEAIIEGNIVELNKLKGCFDELPQFTDEQYNMLENEKCQTIGIVKSNTSDNTIDILLITKSISAFKEYLSVFSDEDKKTIKLKKSHGDGLLTLECSPKVAAILVGSNVINVKDGEDIQVLLTLIRHKL